MINENCIGKEILVNGCKEKLIEIGSFRGIPTYCIEAPKNSSVSNYWLMNINNCHVVRCSDVEYGDEDD